MQETEQGYLIDYCDWTEAWAEQKAIEKSLILRDFDWQVLAFARQFYQDHGVMPLSRRVITFIRQNLNSDFESIKLQERYSDKPLRVIALLAGLPKPIQCI